MSFWSVALPLPLPAFDFAAPLELKTLSSVPIGCRVVVPWQGGVLIGLVVGEGRGGGRTKDALALLERQPWVSVALVETMLEVAQSGRLPLGLLLDDLICSGWDTALEHRVARVLDSNLSPFGEEAAKLTEVFQDASHFAPALLDSVRTQGLLLEQIQKKPRTVQVYVPARAEAKLTLKQQVALNALEREGHFSSLAEWSRNAEVGTGVVGKVVTSGWATLETRPAPPPKLPITPAPPHPEFPNSQIPTSPSPQIQRLHGGSRALRSMHLSRAIHSQLEAGKQVLYIVPDLATLELVWDSFSTLTAALKFSGPLEGEAREYAWERARAGDFGLVIGTPMALSLPLEHLGLIILEEEGSDAYKLQSGTRSFIPELVERYARAAEVGLLLTGAVPAVESLRYPGEVLTPPRARVHVVNYANQGAQPELGPLSQKQFKPKGHGWPLSSDLKTALKQVADRSRQGVLIAPRRGYSAVVKCSSCGFTPMCKNCDVGLRLYAENRQMVCHQCGYHQAPPDVCPVCDSPMWQPKGPGTEWIVNEVRALLPGFSVLRFDKDVQDDLSSVQDGKPAVIVGTQALLSQLAPPDLALVGITFADTWLSMSDFRAGERYHTLLRDLLEWHPSRAPLLIVQTFQADHPALRSVLEGKDAAYYPASELESRKLLHYPPYAKLAQLHLSAREPERAKNAAQEVVNHLLGKGALEHEVLGPAPSPVARVRGMYSYHVLLRANTEGRLETLLGWLSRSWPAKLRVDVSPRSFVGL